MNEKKIEKTFKSYINVSPKNNGETNGSVQEVKPKLLNGEVVVGVAHSVVLLAPLSDRDHGRFGSLFVTNYKLTFVPLEKSLDDECSQRNLLLGPHDAALTSVAAAWLTDGGPARRRRLLPDQDMPQKVKGLQVVCKNMKVLTLSFLNSPAGHGRRVALALAHHAFPKRHDLLFAFEYKEPYYPALPPDLNMFARPADWKRELERRECPHWRITCINGTSDAFMLTAGETLVVAGSVLDYKLVESARHFRAGRVPVWVWGARGGAALLRGGELLPTPQAAAAESVLLEHVRRAHPRLTPPRVLHLCGAPLAPPAPLAPLAPLPPLAALQASYDKLLDLCTPSTLAAFWAQDSQYYAQLEASRWLRHVGGCLAFADDAARHLAANQTVVLQEGDGVDYCAAVASLAQLLLDPHWRTLAGFQSLVQKEWVALGHPFCDRFGLPRAGGAGGGAGGAGGAGGGAGGAEAAPQRAPVFLLFLDCTWQLLQQFPASFQFSETYLTTLWDAAHNHVFDTFLFNCPRDRELAVAKNFVQRPVWDWGEQFSEEDTALFSNPLYMADELAATPKRRSGAGQAAQAQAGEAQERLRPRTAAAALQVWAQCYERWLPPLDARGAGAVQYALFCRAQLAEIRRLKERLSRGGGAGGGGAGEGGGGGGAAPGSVGRFYPFGGLRARTAPPPACVQVSLIDASQLLDSQSLLNAPD